MAKPSGDPMAYHGAADGLAHDESGARRGGPVRPVQMHNKTGTASASATPDDGGELVPVRQPGCSRQHRGRRSGGEPLAALAAAGGDDGATGPRPHPQPEPVRLRAAAVVRLEGALALAHWSALLVDNRARGPTVVISLGNRVPIDGHAS
jgi:hypothetical protein